MKVLRRKQYAQRNQQKMRDVTIYVVDEHRDRVLQYLEKWYFKNRRKMNQKELEYVAGLLKVEPEKMAELQEWYLKKKAIVNTRKLRDYLIQMGKIQDKTIDVPVSLKHYFVKAKKKKNLRDSELPRSMRNHSPFDERYYKQTGIKRLKKPFSKRITPTQSVEDDSVQFEETMQKEQFGVRTMPVGDTQDKEDDDDDYNYDDGDKGFRRDRPSSSKKKKSTSTNKLSKTSRGVKGEIKGGLYAQIEERKVKNTSNLKKDTKTDKSSKKKKRVVGFKGESEEDVEDSDFDDDDNDSYKPKSKKLKKNSKEPNNNENLSLYFDSEVNQILDKIKGFRVSGEGEQLDLAKERDNKVKNRKPTGYPKLKKKISAEEEEEQKMSFKKTEQIEEVEEIEERSEINYNQLDKLAEEVNKETKQLKPVSNKSLNDMIEHQFSKNNSSQKIVAKTTPDSNSSLRKQTGKSDLQENNRYSRDEEVEYYPEMDTFGNKKSTTASGLDKNNTDNQSNNRQTLKEDLELFHENNLEPKRVTLIERSKSGMSVITQKLRPTLVGNEYYYQTVEELFSLNNQRTVSVITRNEKGLVVSNVNIRPSLIGEYYENKIIEVQEGFGHNPIEKKITVVVMNDKGEVVASKILAPSLIGEQDENYEGDFEEVTDTFGHRKSTMTMQNNRGVTTKIHRLRPTLVGNQYYQQIVEEVIGKDGSTKLLCLTKTEKGDVVTVKPIDPKLAGESYYSTIVNDVVTEFGQRKVTVMTCNNRHETLISQNFRPTGFTALGRKYVKDLEGEILEEIVDAFGTKKVTLISKGEKQESVVYQEIRPGTASGFGRDNDRAKSVARHTTIGDRFYEGAVEEIMNDIKTRKETGRLSSKLDAHQREILEQVIYSKLSNPTIGHSAIGRDHYDSLVGKMVIDQADSSSNKISVRPTQIGNNYYIEVVNEANEDDDFFDQIVKSKSVVQESNVNYNKLGRKETNRIVADYLDFKGKRSQTMKPFTHKTNFYDEMMKSELVVRKQTPINYARIAADEYNQIISDHLDARKNSTLVGRVVSDPYKEILADEKVNRKTEIDYEQIDREDYNQMIEDFEKMRNIALRNSEVDPYSAIMKSRVVQRKETEIDYSKIQKEEYNQMIEDYIKLNKTSKVTDRQRASKISQNHYSKISTNSKINKKSTIDYSQIRKDEYNRIIDDYLEVCDEIGISQKNQEGDFYKEIVENNLRQRNTTTIDYSKIAKDEYNQIIDDYLEARKNSERSIRAKQTTNNFYEEIINDKSVVRNSVIDYSAIAKNEYNQIIDDYLKTKEEKDDETVILDADFFEEVIHNASMSRKKTSFNPSKISKAEFNQVVKDYIMSRTNTSVRPDIRQSMLDNYYDQIIANNVVDKSSIDYSLIGRDKYNQIIDDYMKAKEELRLPKRQPDYWTEIMESQLVRKKTTPIDYSRIAKDEYNQIIQDHLAARKNTRLSNRVSKDHYDEIINDKEINKETPIDYEQIDREDYNQIIDDFEVVQKEEDKDNKGDDHYDAVMNSSTVRKKTTTVNYSQIAKDEYNQIIDDFIEARKTTVMASKTSKLSKISDNTIRNKATSYYGKIIDNTIAGQQPELAMRPTIIGQNYYGQIVDAMIDHESNVSISKSPSKRSSLKPSQIANSYYSGLIAETELHRQRLLTARSYVDQFKKKTTLGKSSNQQETPRLTQITDKGYDSERRREMEELQRPLRDSEIPQNKQSLNYALHKEDIRDTSKSYTGKIREDRRVKNSLVDRLDQDRDVDVRQSVPVDKHGYKDDREVSRTMLVKDRTQQQPELRNQSLVDRLDQDREVGMRQSVPVTKEPYRDDREVSRTMLVKDRTQQETIVKNQSLVDRLDQNRDIDMRQSQPGYRQGQQQGRDMSNTMHPTNFYNQPVHNKHESLVNRLDQNRPVDVRGSSPHPYNPNDPYHRDVSHTMHPNLPYNPDQQTRQNNQSLVNRLDQDRDVQNRQSDPHIFNDMSGIGRGKMNTMHPNDFDNRPVDPFYPQQRLIDVHTTPMDQDRSINSANMKDNSSQVDKSFSRIDPEDEERLLKKITEAFMNEKEKLSEDIIKKLEGKMKGGNIEDDGSNLIDEFYRFCRETLPSDDRYKESIMFISLFYYFLEKNNLMK